MRLLIWLLRIVVFVALFGLAVKNSGPVDLRLYFGAIWQAPLSLVILGCFAAGAAIGVTAGLTTLIRLRREIARLRDQLRVRELIRHGAPETARRGSSDGAMREESPVEVADISAMPINTH